MINENKKFRLLKLASVAALIAVAATMSSCAGRPDRQTTSGKTYLFMTARTKLADAIRFQTGKLRVSYKGPRTDNRELFVEASIALPSGREVATHVAVVIDAELRTMSLYVDGQLQKGRAMFGGIVNDTGVVTTPYDSISEAGPYSWGTPLADGGLPPAVDLSGISDINNWLGRSQFVGDDEFSGTLEEFRIYAGALSEALIGVSNKAGPNPAFLPEPLQAGD